MQAVRESRGDADHGSDDGNQPAFPPQAYAAYALTLLIVGYVVAFIDRGILALLIEPIKADLALNDVEISWLMGPAFGIFYVTLGIPIGVLADRYSRRNIIVAGMLLFSAATVLCGLADTFGELFLARVLVGVGEATLTPAALSMISDYFPRGKSVRAIGLFNLGQSVGSGLAFLLGGQVILWVSGAGDTAWPLVGQLMPWQATFVLVALPGVVVATLLLTVREPQRRGFLRGTSVAQPMGSFAEAMRFVGRNIGTFGALMIGNAAVTVTGYSFFWVPSMFARTWDVPAATAGIWYGTVLATMGPAGVIAGSRWAERLYARGQADAPYRVFVFSLAFAVPFAVAMPAMPNALAAILTLSPAMFCLAAASATSTAAVIHVAPAQFRSKVSALHLLVISFAGLFLGPTSVAFLTDRVFADAGMLRWSMLCVAAAACSVGLLALVRARDAYRGLANDADRWHT